MAVDNRKLPTNPAAGITVRPARITRLRSKGLTDVEAAALLSAALRYASTTERPKMVAAKRWVLWLCAYTGARLGEMVQLRGQDVSQVAGTWTVNITPEAGTVKNRAARQVVLHEHLIELGFPAFAAATGDGYLFMTPDKKGNWRGPWRNAKNKVTAFSRSIVTDPGVAPVHGWRHRFKTVGRNVQMPPNVLDAIMGHAAQTVSDAYGDFELAAQVAAMDKFPRYPVE